MAYRSSGRLLVALVAFAALLAVAATVRVPSPLPRADAELTLEVEAVPLDATDPGRDRVGSLSYRGGLWLRSADVRFGGLSDLRLSPDGRQLRAVSDCGRGFTASLAYDSAGRLAALERPRLVDLVGFDGQPLRQGKRDAESLVASGAALEVGFERTNRVLSYAAEPPFTGPARRVATPLGLGRCGSNGGIETMALLGEQRLLICEARRGPSLDVPAWIGSDTRWSEHAYPLLFEGGWAGEPFRPTSAARLPDGDVLVLERRFPPVGARIVRLAGASLEGAQPLEPLEIARFEAPLTLDNFEGIDVRAEGSRTYVYLVSDDNGCAKGDAALVVRRQRTLLLMFALER